MTNDFKNKQSSGARPPRLSPEEYAAKKKAEKEAIYQLLDNTALEVVQSPEKFKAYLDVQSRMDRYTANNALLMYKQFPQASQIKEFDDWAAEGVKVNKGSKTFIILDPYEYTKKDGTIGIDFNLKRVLDVSQTNGKRPAAPTANRDPRKLVAVMLDSAPINIESTNELPYPEVPTLQDFRAELLKQDEPEAKEIALAIELFTNGSLNTFAKHTNVDTNNRLICYDILDLGKQLMPIGMLVVLDSILNRITQNRAKGRNTFIFIDEIYLLFQHEYSANFLFTLWKRVRKYGAYATGITQNVDDLLQSHTARTMLANSEFIIMLNQASTDRLELAKLLNISDLQMSYITNVEAGHGLIKVGSSLVPFANKFPKNTKLYKLMTTKPGESA